MEELRGLLLNPAVQAVLVKFTVDFVKMGLSKLDSSHIVDNYSKYVTMSVVGLSALVSFLNLSLQHHAADFDVAPLVNYFVTLYLATTGVHAVVKNLKG